jgi:two-component system OmpR family response regulator
LLARLRALIRRHVEMPAPMISIADLTIDAQKHRVRRGDRDIELTAKEYEFLLHLARNQGRVVTRPELMSSVWDDARNTYSNIIDVYASRLRRKIDDGEEAALFTTVRGVGFMLAAPEVTASMKKPGGRKRA